MRLEGKKVAILIADGYHEHEMWFPYYRFLEEGAEVFVAGAKEGVVRGEGVFGMDGPIARVKYTIEQVAKEKLDILFLPGGLWGPMALRAMPSVQELVRKCVSEGVLVCAICHSPWILISADVLRGKRATCPSDMAPDLINAGALYSHEPAILDGNILTSPGFYYLPDMFRKLMSLYPEEG